MSSFIMDSSQGSEDVRSAKTKNSGSVLSNSIDPAVIRAQTAQVPDFQPFTTPEQMGYLAYYDIDFAKNFDVIHQSALLAVDSDQLYLHWVKQRNQSRGRWLFLHGLFDHVGLFARWYHYLLSKGYDLLLVDLPGHGLSSGAPAAIDDFDRYDLMLERLLTLSATLSPGPWLGGGQSTGGGIWLQYLVKRQLQLLPVSQLFLFAPLVRPLGYFKIRCLYRVLSPWHKKVRRQFLPNTHNPDFQHFIQDQDPLQSRWVQISWVRAMLKWVRWLEATQKQHHYHCNSPHVHIIQGTSDGTVDWQYNLKWLNQCCPQADIVKLPEVGHHVLNELPQRVAPLWSMLDTWLDN